MQLSVWFVSRLLNEFKKTFSSSSSWQNVKTEKHISWFSFLPQLGWMTLILTTPFPWAIISDWISAHPNEPHTDDFNAQQHP